VDGELALEQAYAPQATRAADTMETVLRGFMTDFS
jgi:hypothetical protein